MGARDIGSYRGPIYFVFMHFPPMRVTRHRKKGRKPRQYQGSNSSIATSRLRQDSQKCHWTAEDEGGRTDQHDAVSGKSNEQEEVEETSSPDTEVDEDGNPLLRGLMYYEHQKKKRRKVIKRISLPIFKGELGERPELHLLYALNWFDAIGLVLDRHNLKKFKHTLDNQAHEWFHDVWHEGRGKLTWHELVIRFSR